TRQMLYLVRAQRLGQRRAATHIEEKLLRSNPLLSNPHNTRAFELRSAIKDRAALHSAQPLFNAIARLRHDRILALLRRSHVDGDFARNRNPEILRASSNIGGLRARHQSLGGRASDVDAGSAKQLPFDKTDRPARLSQFARE